MRIRPFEPDDLPRAVALWNDCVNANEVVYFPITEAYFTEKFMNDPNYDPRFLFTAEEDGAFAGFIAGTAKRVFLAHETNENTPGYLTCVFVRRESRGRGVGRALVSALEAAFRAAGKSRASCCNDNPVNLDWRIPNTPDHDHNNAPGVDAESAAFGFLTHLGYAETGREIAMYLNLNDYVPWAELPARQAKLLAEGVYTGLYDASLGCDFDRMCDRVHSDYWREVIRSEIACWRENRPCTDVRFLPNGKVPDAPRPMLVATHEGHIVAFTGPVDKQASGRGWFCGICTDPEYERRGIATILFNLLMQAFIAEGAAFSTIFTGETNPAQRIYLRTGFRIVKRFVQVSKAI